MKHRTLAAALVAAAALTASGCGILDEESPAAPTVTVQQTVIVGAPAASPAPSSSPSPAAGGAVARVKTTQFGENCPAGTQPSGINRSVRVGCTKILTCTPTDAQGRDVAASVSPRDLIFGEPSPSGLVAVSIGRDTSGLPNPYNLDARALAPGVATFRCIVAGVVNDEDFQLTVIP